MTITTTTPDQQESTPLPVEPPSAPSPEPVEAPAQDTAEVAAVDTADLTPAAPFDPNATQEIDMSQVEQERRDVIQDLAKQVAYLEKARAHLVTAVKYHAECADRHRKSWRSALRMVITLLDNRKRTLKRAATYRAQIATLRHENANLQTSINLLQKALNDRPTVPTAGPRPDLEFALTQERLLVDDLRRDLESALAEVAALKAAQGKPPAPALFQGRTAEDWYRLYSREVSHRDAKIAGGTEFVARAVASTEALS